MEFLFQTPEPLRVFGDGADVFLKDNVLRRGGTAHLREPPEVGRAPVSSARVAEILPEQKSFETELGRLEVPQGIFTGAAEIANGFIFNRGNLHGGEIPRAHQARELDCIPTIRFHPVARLFGHEGGRDDTAELALFRQIAIEPIPTGTSFIDEDQMRGLGLHLANEVVNVTLACADGPEVGDLSAVLWRDVSDGNRVFVDIHSDIQCARLAHG